MASSHDMQPVKWSEGSGSHLSKVKTLAGPWLRFKKLFAKPHVTPEKRKAFDKLSKEDQDNLKKIAGWVTGARYKDGKRKNENLLLRNLMSIDIDYTTTALVDQIEMGVNGMSGYLGLWHSSRRHTPDEPRIRGFFVMDRDVEPDEYLALVRYAGYKIDKEMKTVDPVSYRSAQMMFKPTCSVDDAKNYFFVPQDTARCQPIPVDAWLAEITREFGDWQDLSCLPRNPDEDDHRKRAQKAEDPLEKQGPVGDFCRAYPDIEVAMEKFIPDKYVPGDEMSGNPRYTYAGATSSNGAIIYEGKFLYSFHGTDPVCDTLVNAFDLIRTHLYGDEDTKDAYDSMAKRPSYKAMMELVNDDPLYREQRSHRKFESIYAFDDIAEDDYDDHDEADRHDDDGKDRGSESGTADEGSGDDRDSDDDDRPDDDEADDGERGSSGSWEAHFEAVTPEPRPAARKMRRDFMKPPKDWLATMIEVTKDGEIKPTLHNMKLIVQFDKRFWGKVGFNEFTQRPVLLGTIDPRIPGCVPLVCKDTENGDPWQDHMNYIFEIVLEAPRGSAMPGYGVKVGDADVRKAIKAAAHVNRFHPICEWLDGLVWDGVERAERLFIDYLGEADTDYTRQAAKLFLIACCYRVFTPGFKWDNMIIIRGAQGTRKSTFCNVLASEAWFGELHAEIADHGRIAEQMGGAWIMEIPELVSFNKGEATKLKSFLRRKKDDWRMAYMENVSLLPRQMALMGTTNQQRVLKDDTGNRTFWMFEVKVPKIDTDKLERERAQIFAEAMHWHREMRAETPKGNLPLEFTTTSAIVEATMRQGASRLESIAERLLAEAIEWLDAPVEIEVLLRQACPRHPLIEGFNDGSADGTQLVRRTCFREKDLRLAMTGRDGFSTNIANDNVFQTMLDALVEFGWAKVGRHTRYGKQRGGGGVTGIFFDRVAASGEDIYNGYEIVPDDDFDSESVI